MRVDFCIWKTKHTHSTVHTAGCTTKSNTISRHLKCGLSEFFSCSKNLIELECWMRCKMCNCNVLIINRVAFWLGVFSFNRDFQAHFLFIPFCICWWVLLFFVICTMTVQFVTFDRMNHPKWFAVCCTAAVSLSMKWISLSLTTNSSKITLYLHRMMRDFFDMLLFCLHAATHVSNSPVTWRRWERSEKKEERKKHKTTSRRWDVRETIIPKLIWELHCHRVW